MVTTSVAAFVDEPGQQFLAGAALGLDQYISVGTGGGTCALQGLQQQGRPADDSRAGDCDGYGFSGRPAGGCFLVDAQHDASGRSLELLKRYWFGQIIE